MSEKSTILVVDDDEINREILRDILEPEYDIIEATNGVEALDALRAESGKVDGVVLDLIMPKMDGYEFLEVYSSNPEWKDIPVLIASGDERSQTETRCLQLGAWDVVRKPFNPVVVYLRLKNTISRRQLNLLERRRITETFGRYMEPTVVEQVLRGGMSEEELRGGRNMEIAVLFADIRGFTSLSERLEPEAVVKVLNEYLTLTARAIKKYGGTLDKFIGDCAMAFWGAPAPCEDKEYLACRAAIEMVENAHTMSEEARRLFGMDVPFGVGINVGRAVVGSFGSPERMDYTAIGDTVNTASRLESNAPPGTIYISRAMADKLGDRAITTSLGDEMHLKGKSEGIEVFTLDGLRREEMAHIG